MKRGRDTSRSLTDIRRVLSTARTALKELERQSEYFDFLFQGEVLKGSRHGLGRAEDPHKTFMEADLRKVIEILQRWERTGKTVWPES